MKHVVDRVLPRFWSTGAHTADLGSAQLTYRPGLAGEPTATFLHQLRPTSTDDLQETLSRAEAIIGTRCRRVFLDLQTPAWVEATLIARDWRVDAVLQLVLPAHAATPALPTRTPVIRPVEPADWEQLAALFRADHEEEDHRAGRSVRPVSVTRRVVAARQQLTQPVRYFVAVDDMSITGFVAAWTGDQGIGLIEDLFVRADQRGQKLALALLGQAVTWARANGAQPVVIGADPDDTPRHLYQRLGFVPTTVLRSATRAVADRP